MKKLLFVLAMLILGLTSNSLQAQWVQMSNGMGLDTIVGSLATVGNNIFAGTVNFPTNSGSVYLSTNNGTNWTQTSLVLNNKDVNALATLGNNIFAGSDDGVYLSTNNGTTWVLTSLTNPTVLGLTTLETNIFAGISNGGVYLSTNNGTDWTYCHLEGQSVYSFAKLNNNIFAGRKNDGVYLSTNNGTIWTQTALNNRTVHSLATLGNNIFAGSDTGVYLSTNNGTTWVITSLNNKYVYSLIISGNNIFAGATDGGVYLSTNNGTSWIQKNQGLNGNQIVLPLLIANNYIFAGTYGNSVWRRSYSEILSDIHQIPELVPSSYSLRQNYPNPFNPATTISFSIPSKSFVLLKVFDPLGREMSNLVSEELSAGTYARQWNAPALPSGVYFYRLQAGSFTETKKLLLLR